MDLLRLLSIFTVTFSPRTGLTLQRSTGMVSGCASCTVTIVGRVLVRRRLVRHQAVYTMVDRLRRRVLVRRRQRPRPTVVLQ